MTSLWSATKRMAGVEHKNVLKQTVLNIARGLNENPKKLTLEDMQKEINVTKAAHAEVAEIAPTNTDAKRTRAYLQILSCFERFLIDKNTVLKTPSEVARYLEGSRQCILDSLVALSKASANFKSGTDSFKEIYEAVQNAGINQRKVFAAHGVALEKVAASKRVANSRKRYPMGGKRSTMKSKKSSTRKH